ncbi:MAG: hypothetical protein GF315_08540 [candidate division Zixibacteria bacterium]|nr:hypothetical protein [candidate division Zixibacteria bacterium]
MMRLSRILAVVMFLLLLPSVVSAQWWWGSQFFDESGVNFTPQGASTRARGMGNAYLALSDDVAGATWNPAGAAYMPEGQATLEFLTNTTTMDYSGTATNGNPRDYQYETNDGIFNNFGYISPVRFYHRDFAIGINYYRMADFSKEYDINDDDYQSEYYMKFGLEVIKLTAATQVIPNIALGVNGNIYIRGFTEDYLQTYPGAYEVIGSDTTRSPYHVENKASYSGVNFDIGLQGRFGALSLGAVLNTPYTLTQESTLKQAIVVPHYGEQGTYVNSDLEIDFPIGIGVGAAYTANNLTVSADYSMHQFSETRWSMHPIFVDASYTFFEPYDPTDPNVEVNPYWEDINQYRIGAEYMLNISRFGVPLRAGYRNDPKVYSDKQLIYGIETTETGERQYSIPLGTDTEVGNSETYDQVVGYIVSLGTGLKYKNFWLDFAYEFGSAEQEITSIFAEIEDIDDDGTIEWGNVITENQETIEENPSRLFITLSMTF